MPMLRIQLFGQLSLTCDDSPLPLTSARLQSLLAYLLLHRSTPQARSHLAFVLWPDSSEARARSSLRFLLHQLRHTLPDATLYLEISDQTVQWRAGAPFSLDVLAFERALSLAAESQPGDQRAMLEQAVALYTDDLVVSCYDEWVFPERERLRQRFLAALEQLISLCEQSADYRDAMTYAQRLLRFDPLHEETYRRLMQLHAASGDRVGALRVYHTCVATLRRELDVGPNSATRAAYERLMRPPPQATAPRTQAAPKISRGLPNNLPLQLTSFVGRTHDRSQLQGLLAQARLLTLTGAGGVGKTRLALEVAVQLAHSPSGEDQPVADGVWWIDLAALREPAFVTHVASAALDVREQPGKPLLESLVDYLRDKAALLVLDNCEHLIGACAQLVTTLLSRCPRVRILATSREVLNVAGEQTYTLAPLSLPDGYSVAASAGVSRPGQGQAVPLQDAVQSDAIELFVERAVVALPTFRLTAQNAAGVAQICRRLDGIPLGIELAAARLKLLSVEHLAARLNESLDLLTSGSRSALPRHRTLRAAIDWSYSLLAETERALFRRLAVFRGGFTLQAAEAVCAGGLDVLELLSHLVDKSLVVADVADGEIRHRLLETIHDFARERLEESGEETAQRGRHLGWCLELVREAEPHFYAGEQRAWFTHVEREHDNLRAALAWSLEHDVQAGLQLAGLLSRFWFVRGYWHEGRQWLAQLLARPAAAERTVARARSLCGAGSLALRLADQAAAQALFEEGLSIAEEAGARRVAAQALDSLGLIAQQRGELARARTLKTEGLTLYRTLDDTWGTAGSLYSLGHIALLEADYAGARAFYEESLRLRRAIGDRIGMAYALNNLGNVAGHQAEPEQARAYYEESLALMREVGDRSGIGGAILNLGRVALSLGDLAAARPQIAESLRLARETDNRPLEAHALSDLGEIERGEGHYAQAQQLFTQCLALLREAGSHSETAFTLQSLGQVALAQGDVPQALRHFRESLCMLQSGGRTQNILLCLTGVGAAATRAGEPLRGARLLAACQAQHEALGMRMDYLDRLVFERSVALLRAQLDQGIFDGVWAEGCTLTLEQAVAEAQQVFHASGGENHTG